ncbi:recombinase family protein [Spirosoma aureum]|uniref:recombinase family protein n=1 Tax=Spirosoma aureum TaxID=2692134 RepID=UPI001E4A9908|nr:recombinase family protein [Spirosoma aureum]
MADHKASGSKTEQPELNRLLEILREGDTLMIWKLDGADRPAIGPCSLSHLIEIVTQLEQQHVGWVSKFNRSYCSCASG